MSYGSNQANTPGRPPTNEPQPAEGQFAPHRGTMILVFGILGLAGLPLGMGCCIIFAVFSAFSVAAWVMGQKDLKKIDAGYMDPSGRQSTNAGRICGIIGTILWGVGIIGMVILAVIGVSMGMLDAQP